jgi:hypothetical protein
MICRANGGQVKRRENVGGEKGDMIPGNWEGGSDARTMGFSFTYEHLEVNQKPWRISIILQTRECSAPDGITIQFII